MSAENYPETMSAPATPAKPAQDSPSLWQRSLWPLLLCVALPLFVLSLIEEHWLSLEGRIGTMFGVGIGAAAGLTVAAVFVKAADLRRQRREAKAASAGSS